MLDARGIVRPIATLVVAVAIALVATTGEAGAAAPSDRWITAEATFLSGRSVAVTCASNAVDWSQALAAAGFAPDGANQTYGFSLLERGEMHLSPYVCEGLRLGRRASTRRQNELQVSWSVNVLIHESVHLGRSTTDEALTEACARDGLPSELRRLYGVGYQAPELKRLTVAATWFRRTQGPAYRGGSCLAA